MSQDDEVCLCFHVSRRKLVGYVKRERPAVASLVSECLGAGTGCGWCVPYLRTLHKQVMAGEVDPVLPVDAKTYEAKRAAYRETGERGG